MNTSHAPKLPVKKNAVQTALDMHRERLSILRQAKFCNEALELNLLFDHRWYSATYLKQELSFGRALAHFLSEGLGKYYDPSPFFSTLYYAGQAELETWPVHIILHYIQKGAANGLNPCPLFDSPWYYAKYQVAASGLTPLAHFVQAARQGVMNDPNEFFDCALYIKEHGIHHEYPHPIFHYQDYAENLEIRPSSEFDTAGYLLAYEDVKGSGMNPLEHYLRSGRFEGRNPKPLAITFDADRLRLKEFGSASADNKLVFYTAVVGDDSRLLPPAELIPGARYVCFSDLPRQTYGIWSIQPLPEGAGRSPGMSVLWCKLHPHELFTDVEIAVWLDSHIVVNGDLAPYIRQMLDNGLPVGIIRHPEQERTRPDATARAGSDENMQTPPLKEPRPLPPWPPRGDLDEKDIIISDLRHPALPQFYDLWRRQLAARHSGGEAILARVLAKLQLKPRDSLPGKLSGGDGKEFIFLSDDSVFDLKTQDAIFSSEIAFPELPVTFSEHRRRHPDCFDAVKERRADVIVAVHNALDYVKACFNSLLPTLREADGLFVVNDKSDSETSAWLREFAKTDSRITLIENDRNLGYTGSANRGLQASNAPFRIMLNSDTLVSAHWLEKLLLVAYHDDNTGIVGPLSSAASYQSVPFLEFTAANTPINKLPPRKTVEDMDRLCEGAAPYGIYPSVPLVHGFCLGIRQEVIDKIGFFDEINFARFFGEENDYCMRAIEAGFTLRVATPVYVFHAKSRSISEEIRLASLGEAGNTLRRIYGSKRIETTLRKLQCNPLLLYMRSICASFYDFCKTSLGSYTDKLNHAGFVVEKTNGIVSIFNDKVIIKGKLDNTVGTMYEVFIKECYAFASNNEFVVYDIGFNIGCASLYFALHGNIKRIYAFEPFAPTYRQGMSNLAANAKLAEKIAVFNYGLGDRDEVLFRSYNEDAPGSMSSVADRFAGKGPVEEIIIKKASDVLPPLFAAHSEHIFLKIDCEGAEKNILSNMAQVNSLADVSVLALEWHFEYPEDIVEILKENNFFIFLNHTEHNKFGMLYALNNTKFYHNASLRNKN